MKKSRTPGTADRPEDKRPLPPSFEMHAAEPLTESDVYPSGTVRLTYRSGYDGQQDWALYTPGDPARNAVVYLHGSFAHADQIYVRKDIRDFWLARILEGRHPLLSINMRDTSYMSPAATRDLTDLLNFCRKRYEFGKIVLLGGSGGASSAMAFACVHPDQIDGVIAMGMCDILTRLDFARKSDLPLLRDLAEAIINAYGGPPEKNPHPYRERSVLKHIDRLTLPIVLSIGEKDNLIPVGETRKIASAMRHNPDFTYIEIAGGGHDSALWIDVDPRTLTR